MEITVISRMGISCPEWELLYFPRLGIILIPQISSSEWKLVAHNGSYYNSPGSELVAQMGITVIHKNGN